MSAPLAGSLATRRLRGVLCVAASTLFAACATTTAPNPAPGVAMRQVPLALGHTSTGGTRLIHPMPVYPPALLAAHLPPVTIRARLMVDAQGRVTDVRIDDEAQAGPRRRVFADAVHQAAMTWTFVPLHTSHWAADANGNAHDTGSEAQPFHLDYLFRFAWEGDRPVTDAHAAGDLPPSGHGDD